MKAVAHRWVLTALFATYVLTRYPDVGGRINMGDSAKFQFLARVLGIGHASGNPVYLMASALWVRLPIPLSDATKVTLLSGVAGIGAIALVSQAVHLLDLPALSLPRLTLEVRSLAAILLGLGSLFWTLSTEAEVYTLGALFVGGVVLGLARWCIRSDARGLYLAIGSLGLGLGNHLTIVALAPAVLYAIFGDAAGRALLRTPRFWLVVGGALALAVLPYGWIAWRLSHAPLAYSELPAPFEWRAFYRFVTARGVADATHTHFNYRVAIERMPDLFAQLQKQWLWPLLLFAPFGAVRLHQLQRRFAVALALGGLGYFGIALWFQIPDPEGLFVPVSVLLAIPLALAPNGTTPLATMLGLHAMLAVLHVGLWSHDEYSAYVQQTPEGKVVVNLPTLHEVAPEHAMIGVPCGHYGCVEITAYYALVDTELRERDVSFVRFAWSEWDDGKLAVPLVDPKAPQTRPICVILNNDLTKLRELGLDPKPIARAPVKVHSRTFTSPPLYCVAPHP